jgi:hypothetical protein
VCFVVHKTTSEQERAILTSLYLVAVKNTDNLGLKPRPSWGGGAMGGPEGGNGGGGGGDGRE